jgi:dihydrofolate reductase
MTYKDNKDAFQVSLSLSSLHPVGLSTLLITIQPLAERIIKIVSRSLDTTKVEDWHVRANKRFDETLAVSGA